MAYAGLTHILGTLLMIVGLIYWGMSALSDYFTKGQYSRNITHLLGGFGLLLLALHFVVSEPIASALALLAATRLNVVLVAASSLLLLAAIVTFGAITYGRPLRLRRQLEIARQLRHGLQNVK